jgi:adenylate cyclase
MPPAERGNSPGAPESKMLEVPAADVRRQLARIFASPQFVNTVRLQRFLEVTVEWTLAGRGDELKEYTLGREAFDRGDDYDPRNDSIVRVEAQRLRGKLRDYYASGGRTDPVTIALKPGSYVPAFTWAAQAVLTMPPAPPPADRNTVAVLPFTNLSPEPEQDYFCDGITEDIINELTSIRELNVVGRTSTFAFKGSRIDLREIGARLSAGTVIEGSVRKAGDMLRVSAKIIDAESGRALWSESFDRRTGDVFAIEDEIAGAIAGTLRVTLAVPHNGERHGAPGFEAYSLYLKGRHAWNQMTPSGYADAIDLYSRAVSLYPDYALPYSGLADCYSWLAMWGLRRPHEMFPKAKRAALEALRIEARLAHAYASLGVVPLRSCVERRHGDAAQIDRAGRQLCAGSSRARPQPDVPGQSR